jgi:hypothetical protein
MDVPRQAHAVEHSPTDVPDNRPLSDRFADRSLTLDIEQQLAHRSQEHSLVAGDVGPRCGDDDVAVNYDTTY